MMTRKDAIIYAIKIIEDNCNSNDQDAMCAIQKLTECANALPDIGWSQKKILDACEQYCKDNNRNYLCNSDFKNEKMPASNNIKRHFKMSVKDFINAYFPQPEWYSSSITYKKTDKEKLLKCFKEEMDSLYITSRNDYDKKRKTGSPASITLMRLFEVKTWDELKRIANVKDYKKIRNIAIESNSRLHNNQYEKKVIKIK